MSKNFAYSLVATAPSPATSGTSLVVTAGQGALFPAVPFQATIWPINARPISTNAEIVTVTGVSTDTLTIVRAQESTTARSVIIGDQIAATLTNNNVPTNPVLIDGAATDNDYVLRASQAFTAVDHFETGSGYITEVPATSTLEVVSYAPATANKFGVLGTDSSWAWQTWPVTFTNLAIGNGTLSYAKFTQDGKRVDFRLKFTLGSTSSVSGAIQFSAPVPLHGDYSGSDVINASVQMLDASTGNPFQGAVIFSSATLMEVRCWDVATFVKQNLTSSSNPMVWTTSDYLQIHGTYETS